jgi:hypothetical protein
MPVDARTTPSWARLPVLALLALLTGYNVWCWSHALDESAPPSTSRWFATWQMFTLLDPGHSELVAEAEIDGQWQPVDLVALFPTKWESGPRYARSGFWENGARLRVLAAATCGRHPAHPTRVRFHSERWKKTLGQVKQPQRHLRKEDLLDWDCTKQVSLPRGELW